MFSADFRLITENSYQEEQIREDISWSDLSSIQKREIIISVAKVVAVIFLSILVLSAILILTLISPPPIGLFLGIPMLFGACVATAIVVNFFYEKAAKLVQTHMHPKNPVVIE